MAREMKDSGIEWIGEIPEEWDILRLKSLFSFGKGLPITKDSLVEIGVPVISYGQIHGKYNSGVHLHNELIRYVPETYLTTNPESLVHEGDLILADTSEDIDGCGNCAYIDSNMQVFAGYHTIILKASKQTNNKYIAYLMKTDPWRSQLRSKVSGVKVFSISRKIISNAVIILPPVPTQHRIAAFLDRKCAEIDSVIADTQKTIEEYKALKQSIITEAVTKGVRGERKMKDSGVEWLPEIPEDWDAKRGKQLFVETNERSVDGHEELLTVSHITGVTPRSAKNVNMFMSESLVDYKICHVGDLAANTMWMWQGAIGVSNYEGVISPSYNTYRQRTHAYYSGYLEYLLRVPVLVST